MWGKTSEQTIGKTLLENGYEPWHAEMHEHEIDAVIATGESIRGEVSFAHSVLGKRIYDYIFSPVYDANNKVAAISGITRDVTEHRNHELERQKMRDDFALLRNTSAAANEALNATNAELQTSKFLLNQANDNLDQILNMLPASVVVIRGYDLRVEMINESGKYCNIGISSEYGPINK